MPVSGSTSPCACAVSGDARAIPPHSYRIDTAGYVGLFAGSDYSGSQPDRRRSR